MKLKLPFILLLTIASTVVGYSQGQQDALPVQVRAILHDPVKGTADLFYLDKSGDAAPLNFRRNNLSRPFKTISVNGSLVLYDKAVENADDLEANQEHIAAIAKIPEGLRKAIIVVIAAPAGRTPAYRILVIEDTEKAFPGGESLVLSLISSNVVVQAGEHVVPVRPGKLTRVPFVEEVNDFNMAQTNFHYEKDGKWITFAERRLQYLKVTRRLFIIYFRPGAIQPTVTAIMDNSFQNR